MQFYTSQIFKKTMHSGVNTLNIIIKITKYFECKIYSNGILYQKHDLCLNHETRKYRLILSLYDNKPRDRVETIMYKVFMLDNLLEFL